MKKIILTAFAVLFVGFTYAQNVGQKVQANHNGTWYDAHILKVNDQGEYYVKYDGWSDSWNEWLTKDKLKGYESSSKLTKFKVGDHVEVEYGMLPAPARIMEVGENKYHVKFDKKSFGDKWVRESQIKKL